MRKCRAERCNILRPGAEDRHTGSTIGKSLKIRLRRDEVQQPPCICHAMFDPSRYPLTPPSQKRRQKQRSGSTMRPLNTNVRCRKIGAAEAERTVCCFRVPEQDKRRFFRLKQLFVRRYGDGVGSFDARQNAPVPVGQGQWPSPSRIDMGPCR